MATIDSSIALQARPIEVPDQLQQYARVQQIQGLQNQSAIQQMAMQDKQRSYDDQTALTNAIRRNMNPTTGQPDNEGIVRDLASTGSGHLIQQFQNGVLTNEKTRAEIDSSKGKANKDNADAEVARRQAAKHQFEMAGQLAGAWATDPTVTKQKILAGLEASLHSGVISPEIAQAKVKELDAVGDDAASLNGWAKVTLKQIMTAKEQHDANEPTLGTTNLGGKTVFTSRNKETGVVTTNTSMDNTQSPDNAASNATSRANNRDTIAGENLRAGISADGSPTGDTQSLIDGIYSGHIQPPNGMALRNPRMLSVMTQLMSQHPDFDAARWGERAKAVKDFGTGPQGQAVQSANTALNHLDTLKQLADAQGNGDFRKFNELANYLASQTGGAAPTNLQGAVTMVGPEISKAVVGAGGTGGDREKVDKALDALVKGGPTQASGQVATMQELFGGRLSESARTYERTTGNKNFNETFLSPSAQAIMAKRKASTSNPGTAPVSSDLHDRAAAIIRGDK